MTDHRLHSSRLSWSTISRSLSVANDDRSIVTVRRTGKTDGKDAPNEPPSSILQDNLGDSIINAAHPLIQTQKMQASNPIVPTVGSTFEKDLEASRPYIRALKRYSSCTATSSVAPSMGWSFFSGISIAEVSCLSAIGLPIAPQDLWNGNRYHIANSNRHNYLEEPGPVQTKLPERILHSMARNSATSLATVTDLNIYKLSSVGEFGIERKTPKECHKIALLGIVYGILSLQLEVHEYQDADYLGTSLSGKTTLCTHLQELYGQGSRYHDHVQVCKIIVQDLLGAFNIACRGVNAETGLPDRYRLVSILSTF